MKKIILPLLATLLVPFSEVVATSSAEILFASSPDNIETSAPLDDLRGDEAFRRDYGNGLYNVGVATGYQVIDLGEYKYGTSGYALYLYVWNCEQDTNFSFKSPQNRVEILNQKNKEYIHLNVEFISNSFNQFYKYKIEFDESEVSFVSGNARSYDIVGFEAYEGSNLNASDHTVGKRFKYTGFYYDNTLACESSDLETLHLNISGGVYRTASSSQSGTARNDLYYVWFDVNKNLFTKYGNLYAIHCDYYQFDMSYKISALLSDHVHDMDGYQGIEEKNNGSMIEGYYYGWEQYPYTIGSDVERWMNSHDMLNYKNNAVIEVDSMNTKITGTYLDQLYRVEDVCNMLGIRFQDIRLDPSKGYYNNINITADNTYDLLSYGQHHNGWDNFWAWLRGVNTSERDMTGIPAIERFQDVESINSSTCIAEEDKTEMANLITSTKDVVCLRFATGIYDSTTIRHGRYYDHDDSSHFIENTPIGFMAIQGFYAFIDFDIIDVTFMNSMGEKTVLPVVADPINIWTDFENTTYLTNKIDWPKIIRLILIILGIFILLLVGLWLLPKTLKIDTSKSNKKRRK